MRCPGGTVKRFEIEPVVTKANIKGYVMWKNNFAAKKKVDRR